MTWIINAGHALATMMLNVINSARAFTIANPGTGDAVVHWWLTYFEGEPDLP